MPLKNGYSEKTVSDNIGELIRSGHKKIQAVAIALKKGREAWTKRFPGVPYPHHLHEVHHRAQRVARGENPKKRKKNPKKSHRIAIDHRTALKMFYDVGYDTEAKLKRANEALEAISQPTEGYFYADDVSALIDRMGGDLTSIGDILKGLKLPRKKASPKRRKNPVRKLDEYVLAISTNQGPVYYASGRAGRTRFDTEKEKAKRFKGREAAEHMKGDLKRFLDLTARIVKA